MPAVSRNQEANLGKRPDRQMIGSNRHVIQSSALDSFKGFEVVVRTLGGNQWEGIFLDYDKYTLTLMPNAPEVPGADIHPVLIYKQGIESIHQR